MVSLFALHLLLIDSVILQRYKTTVSRLRPITFIYIYSICDFFVLLSTFPIGSASTTCHRSLLIVRTFIHIYVHTYVYTYMRTYYMGWKVPGFLMKTSVFWAKLYLFLNIIAFAGDTLGIAIFQHFRCPFCSTKRPSLRNTPRSRRLRREDCGQLRRIIDFISCRRYT